MLARFLAGLYSHKACPDTLLGSFVTQSCTQLLTHQPTLAHSHSPTFATALNQLSPLLAQLLGCSLTPSLTHPCTHALAHLLTPLFACLLTPLTQPLIPLHTLNCSLAFYHYYQHMILSYQPVFRQVCLVTQSISGDYCKRLSCCCKNSERPRCKLSPGLVKPVLSAE